MARARKKKPWDDAFRRIRCVYDVTYWYPPKPNEGDVDAVGRLLSIDFPASYRAFAQEFGLDGDFGLPTLLPLAPPDRSWHYAGAGMGEYRPTEDDWSSVPGATRGVRAEHTEAFMDFADTAPPGLGDRLVVFAEDPGYDLFVFDPADVTDEGAGECRIYGVGRHGHTEAIANSFPEWLAWIERSYRSDEDNAAAADAWPPVAEYPHAYKPSSPESRPLNYRRSVLRPKAVPDPSDVRRWLAWNNGAVPAIARSLRDDNRHDAYAVIADALEDAGCPANELLAACRTGDPDVDGLWALAVLLDNH